ncbi:MAG: HEAT repeat domain-containing protein [Planctomycetes bacterium]|nr:HEAT repeat domain-containing protein [Planctomycetota bacterium]
MSRFLWTRTLLAAAVFGALFCVTGNVQADPAEEAVRIAGKKIGEKNPDVRAQAVEDLARANNKAGTTLIMQCLATEDDGPAGYRMAEAVRMLTSEEALEVIEKNVLKWTKPENLFGAYWTFMGLSGQNSEPANAILRKAIDESKDDDIYLRSAAIEAMAETGRTDMADLLLKVLKSYDPDWDEKSPIIVLTSVQGAPKMVGGGDTKKRNEVVLALADILEKTKDDRIQWFTCTALSKITGEDTYIEAGFWRWWVEMGGKKVERREEGATVAGRDVPKFFKAAAVGKRVMFVIDISGSMQHPVELPPEMKKPPEPEPKKEEGPTTGGGKSGKKGDSDEEEKKPVIPPPDYSKVKSKLDLAKVELIHTLRHLPDDYWFNIVIYHTAHDMIDGSNKEFVQASEANKAKFIKKVEGLNWASLTNIHGALTRSFCVNKKKTLDPMKIGKNTNNPAWDPECLRTGATTIFFLTDGTPTISDDCTDTGQVGRQGGPMIGNGRFCQTNNIALDIKRLNVFRKAVINTVGIGPHDGTLLGALAQMSGGEYIDRSGIAR